MATLRFFRHYIRLPFLLLGVSEFTVLFASVYVAAWFGLQDFAGTSLSLVLKAGVYATIVMIAMIAVGLYQPGLRGGPTAVLLRLGVALTGAVMAIALLYFLFPSSLALDRAVLILSMLVSIFGIGLSRSTFSRIVDQKLIKRRILVLGDGHQAGLIKSFLAKANSTFGFDIVGYARTRGDTLHPDNDQNSLTIDVPLLEYVRQHKLDEIVVAMDDRRRGFPVQELLDCRMSGIDVVDVINFFERETGSIRIDLVQPSWFVFADGFKLNGGDRILSRLMDYSGSLLLLLIGSPFMLATALAIKLEEGMDAPIFYTQTRVGRFGKHYRLFKFRSMYVNAEAPGQARWAEQDDPRITRTGAIIRKLRIDELPQIFNVIRNEMSLVGPRPERPHFVEEFRKTIPYYDDRHRVRPGITGWAQLNYPYGSSVDDTVQKLQYDLYYIKNGSLFLDILILLQTAEVVLWGKGAR